MTDHLRSFPIMHPSIPYLPVFTYKDLGINLVEAS